MELLILYEQWAGERLVVESAVPFARRVGRPISVSAVPDGPSIDIWRSCRFLGAMIRALCGLPGGVWVGFCLVVLVLTTVVFGLLVGRGVVMVLLLGHVKLLLMIFLDELLVLFWVSFCLLNFLFSVRGGLVSGWQLRVQFLLRGV